MQILDIHNKIDQYIQLFKMNKMCGNFAIRFNFFKGGITNIDSEVKETNKLEKGINFKEHKS